MKWLVVILMTMTLVVSAQVGCNVQDFYGLAYTWHNPTERHQKLLSWLHLHGNKCNKEQLIVIWNNLPQWAGTSDSVEIRQEITLLYELLAVKERK